MHLINAYNLIEYMDIQINHILGNPTLKKELDS